MDRSKIYRFRSLALVLAATLSLPSFSAADPVTLEWTLPTKNTDGSELTDLAALQIYWGDQQGSYPDSVRIDDPGATSYIFETEFENDGRTWYFVGTAINSQEVESNFSNVATRIMPVATLFPISNLVVIVSPGTGARYVLPETDFFGSPVIAGNWSVPGQTLIINFEITPRSWPRHDVRIISKAISTAERDHWFMVSMYGGGHVLRFRLKTNGTTHTLYGSTSIPLNTKTVGRVEYDGASMRIFVNGTLDASRSKSGDMDISSAGVWVGGNPPDNYGAFDGLISVTVQ